MAGANKLPSGTWRGWFRDYEGRRAFFTLGRAATRREVLTTAQTLEVEHAQIRLGVKPKPDGRRTTMARPIKEALEEYLAWGAFQGARGGRPWSPKHGRMRAAQLHWWIACLHLRTLADCQGILSAVERGLQALAGDGRSSQTVKHYLASIAAFTHWCTQRDYVPLDPLVRCSPVQVVHKRKRRALTLAEVRQLLECCHPAHRLLYETALVTGLRANELRQLSLTHLDIDQCGLHLEAAWTKNRQPGWQPLSRDLLVRLYVSGRDGEPRERYRRAGSRMPLPEQPLLAVPRNTATMVVADCQRAGIALRTSEGVADFHALRTTAINVILAQGATAVEAQAFARHRSLDMTINTYGRTEIARVRALVEDVARAIIPEPERASHVHAMAVGEPIAMPGRRGTPQGEQPIMPLQLALIKTDSAQADPKPRQNSPGDTGDPLRNHPSFRRPHQGQWNKGCCPP
jgi:integrase